ncbi:hypothetical protein D3C71_1353250 [compost metagenome]
MKGYGKRLVQILHEIQNVRTGFSSENAEFMLERHNADIASVQAFGQLFVSSPLVLGDLIYIRIVVGDQAAARFDGEDRIFSFPSFCLADTLPKMVSVRGNTALLRHVGSDISYASHSIQPPLIFDDYGANGVDGKQLFTSYL